MGAPVSNPLRACERYHAACVSLKADLGNCRFDGRDQFVVGDDVVRGDGFDDHLLDGALRFGFRFFGFRGRGLRQSSFCRSWAGFLFSVLSCSSSRFS